MDWLSRLLDLNPVQGRLDVRCAFGAPWRVDHAPAEMGEIQYHLIVAGTATLDDPVTGTSQSLAAGDILILPDGGAHVLGDGSGAAPRAIRSRVAGDLVIKENDGGGTRLDMLCGRFILVNAQDRLLRPYLPPRLIIRSAAVGGSVTGRQLQALTALMRAEADSDRLGARAMLDLLSAALFTLALRLAGEGTSAPTGLLALAGNPRLRPAVTALFNQPARDWTLPELAALCHMSRATFARHFQDSFGRSASDLLTDIRMALAANALKVPGTTTAVAAETAGYQSEAAFQRVFKQRMGLTPAQWRRIALSKAPPATGG
ncbi:AraC family transcriptional regulator [Dongia rigui]|uniref:AraC family transcriptional regulator n=1 Tax=Dongia rigui TaxID=940149 RepID=A0ABU5E1Z4_9PROT|nr:AraC family transcriptional regulator [Dongia rigui]MDY0872836.1 AraC family transcriptional regulator [Dongia rigui]